MLNYAVDPAVLPRICPPASSSTSGTAPTYVSVVGFMFLRTRVLGLAIPFHRNFPEVNLRFYVRRRGRPGAARRRRRLQARRRLHQGDRAARRIALVARVLYGEAYVALPMRRRSPSTTEPPPRPRPRRLRLAPRPDWHGLDLAIDGAPAAARPRLRGRLHHRALLGLRRRLRPHPRVPRRTPPLARLAGPGAALRATLPPSMARLRRRPRRPPALGLPRRGLRGRRVPRTLTHRLSRDPGILPGNSRALTPAYRPSRRSPSRSPSPSPSFTRRPPTPAAACCSPTASASAA